MASERPVDDWNEQAKAVERWRDGRRNTLDAWLERSHDSFTTLAGFHGMSFPGAHNDLRIRLETKEAAHAAMEILRAAQAEGIAVDADRFAIVRENGSDASPYVIQPTVDDQ